MLYYTDGTRENGGCNWTQWWIGYSMPQTTGRVVTFQADGDELLVILQALKAASKTEPKVIEVVRSVLNGDS